MKDIFTILGPKVFGKVCVWLSREREYQQEKFGGLEVDLARDSEWWEQQLNTYVGRAFVLGLDTPGGRQAICKLVATGVALMEVIDTQHGLPSPGHSSGNGLG